MEGWSLLISHEKYIKDGKVLDHLGCQSKVLPGPFTDLSAWVGFCTSSPQQGVKYQHWYLIFLYGGEKIKYQCWYLTPCCGLEVHKPTQELKSVKGPGNTFDWHPKWERTLPSLIYFSWDIYRDPPSIKKIKYQCWYLTPCCGLEVQKPTQALSQLKTRPIPLIETPSGQELCRP
jgi:hypothetical protein